jgi:uncharacterized membrane protein
MSAAKRAAVTIGINYDRFPAEVDRGVQTRAGLNRLQFAEADAQDLAKELESAGYDVVRLTGPAATRRAIIDAILRQRQAVGADGLLLVHFSGHGDVDTDGNAYLLPADADPQNLLATAIPLDDLAQRYLGRLEAAVTLLDCCHSGYAVGMRGGEANERGEPQSFLNQARAIFQQVRGRIVLAACGGDQLAREFADLRHGAFTYYALEHLRTNPDAVDVELLYREIDQGLEGRGLPPPVRGGATVGRIVLRDPLPERLPGPVSPFAPYPNQDRRVQLRQALLALSADQLDEVLFRLGTSYDRLQGSDHGARLRNLIRGLDQAGQLDLLDQALGDVQAAEQVAREQAEREAAERAQEGRLEREKAQQAAAEQAAREQAEREAAERAEQARQERAGEEPVAAGQTAHKQDRREAKVGAEKERRERERQEQLQREALQGNLAQHGLEQITQVSSSTQSGGTRRATSINLWAIHLRQVAYIAISNVVYVVPTLFGTVGAELGSGILLFTAVAFGPSVGFISGCLGSFIVYVLVIKNPNSADLGGLFVWILGNGIVGLIAGLSVFYARRLDNPRAIATAVGFALLGTLVGFAVFAATLITSYKVVPAELFEMLLTRALSAIILIPILSVARETIRARIGQ